MFDMSKLGDMMQKARQMQEQMQAMQQEMARKQITAEAAGGFVTATVDGSLTLTALKIDASKGDAGDLEYLEDAVVAAVAAAQARAAETMKAEMGKITQGLELPPGLMP